MKKLHNLEDEWNPVVNHEIRERGHPGGDEVPGWTEVGFTSEIVRHPLQLIRIFAGDPQDVPATVFAAPHLNDVGPGTGMSLDDVSVWTDGSCTENGSKYAKAGSGLWYAVDDARNQAIRLPGEYLTNNTAELAAMLLSIQTHRDVQTVRIISDSTYAITSATTLLRKRLDHGFLDVPNPKYVAALVGEIIHTNSRILVRKVRGHAGIEGNEGADREAAKGAEKDDPTPIDLSKGEHLLKIGAKLSVLSQSELYKAIRLHHMHDNRKNTHRAVKQAGCH
ncbi:hypothetical protein D9611_010698 [Ephemerocybe angulata]|uniref:ribonuclease H n=1 Tax=Ephemerocybe angulata TaxID=980116 RepID=A0A8H5BE26_9AGAR|nr:hypothetical protein D9611_010698 [Tulosesus angulatus]